MMITGIQAVYIILCMHQYLCVMRDPCRYGWCLCVADEEFFGTALCKISITTPKQKFPYATVAIGLCFFYNFLGIRTFSPILYTSLTFPHMNLHISLKPKIRKFGFSSRGYCAGVYIYSPPPFPSSLLSHLPPSLPLSHSLLSHPQFAVILLSNLVCQGSIITYLFTETKEVLVPTYTS